MNHSNAQPVVWGNCISPCPNPGIIQNSTAPAGGRLWGSKVRRFTGVAQIICGVIELAIGIAVICIPTRNYYDHMDYVGWGIWTGVFAIVTGFLGVYSLSSRCMVIAYMICSIIAAALSGGSCIYAGIGAAVTDTDYYDWSLWYNPGSPANMPLYIVMCITFFANMVISIIGASFTCGALSPGRSQPQQIVYYTPQQMPPMTVPAPPYTVNPTQGAVGYSVPSPMTNDPEMLSKNV